MGRKLLLTPSGDPRRNPEKQTVGAATASHKMLTLQALSSSLNTGTAKGSCLGRGEAFGCPPAVCPPKRPRPFAHQRILGLQKGSKSHVRVVFESFSSPLQKPLWSHFCLSFFSWCFLFPWCFSCWRFPCSF